MKIKTINTENTTILNLNGRLDNHGSEILEQLAFKIIADGCHNIIINCSDLQYISSAGLRVLMLIARKSATPGGRLVLCCTNEFVSDVLALSSFDSVAGIYDRLDEALSVF